MAGLTPIIDKLQKKLEKEPNSLIFLQLVEENRKEGLYEDALKVCREGLRRHPNYWSARVAMGRIYHEMGEDDKARDELERVTKAVPDNLLANKLLGDIYLEVKRYPEALKRYQLVQMLTPTDQEVVGNIQKIESILSGSVPVMPSEVSAAPQAAPTVIVPPPVAVMEAARPAPELPVAPPVPPLEPVIEDLDQTVPATPTMKLQPVAEIVPPPATAAFAAPEIVQQAQAEPPEHFPDVPAVILPERPVPQPAALEPEAAPEPAAAQRPTKRPPEEDEQAEKELAAILLDVGYSNDPVKLALPPTAEEGRETPVPEDMPGVSIQDIATAQAAARSMRREETTQPMVPQPAGAVEETDEEEADELTTQTLAELYVQQGFLDKAVKVYQKLLLNDPTNKQIVQRLKELSPAEALFPAGGEERQQPAGAPSSPASGSAGARTRQEPGPGKKKLSKDNNVSDLSLERRRKISTLENWLASIRREHS